jgi:hypothetical protein
MHWERYHQTDCPTSIFSTLKCLNENHGRKRLLDPLEEYFMYWFRLRHSIPEKVLADLFYVSVGSVKIEISSIVH